VLIIITMAITIKGPGMFSSLTVHIFGFGGRLGCVYIVFND